MTHTSKTTRRLAVAMSLAMLVAGCAAILSGTPAIRAPQSVAAHPNTEVVGAAALGNRGPRADAGRTQAMLGKLPLYFVQNHGQEDARVAYYVQGHDTAVYFGPDGVTFALSRSTSGAPQDAAGAPTVQDAATAQTVSGRVPVRLASTRPDRPTAKERWAVKLDFIGANRVSPAGRELAPAVVSYFTGRDGQARGASETYRGVTYAELWPGIDLVYTGAGGQLKSTFIVKPGADPSRIRLAYRGATDVRVTDAGRLEVSTPVGSFADDRPYAYQDMSGGRTEVPVMFALAEPAADGAREYGFTVKDYDRSQTLVLDPSLIVYAGFIGGTGTDQANGIAVDAAGNAYVVGATDSTVPSFPAKIGPDVSHNGGTYDAFVAKVKADGTDLLYLGYIGGSGDDHGTGIAVDGAGNAYISGYTSSDQSSFPVKVGPDLSYGGGLYDAFVAKIKPDGSGLVYCGYVGGASDDRAWGIDVDTAGNAYLTGATGSDANTFPVKVGPSVVYHGGDDAFVAKVKADGSGLSYAGYIGGWGAEQATGIAVDAGGNAYVTGWTTSDQLSFPVKIGPDLTYSGGVTDAFVAKVKADGTSLVYAGYIGGADTDRGTAIAVDASGNAYVAGYTDSDQTTFPVKVGPDLSYSGNWDAFVAKVKPDGSALVYAGYIGGAGDDFARGIAVDAAGSAYVTGGTDSDTATFNPYLGPMVSRLGGPEVFVANVMPDGSSLRWHGYISGTGNETGRGIAVDAAHNIYVAGYTTSADGSFPVAVGPDLVYGGGSQDAFVTKISGKPDLYEATLFIATGTTKPGGAISVIDVAANKGLGPSAGSLTRYYLSTDYTKSLNDILLSGSRAVPGLQAGDSNGGWAVTVTVPVATPLGTYHLIACADDAKAIAEVDEGNNCTATNSTVQVTLPDLVEKGVTGVPASIQRGKAFVATDTVSNAGAIGAGATTTRYYLSKDTAKGVGDILVTGMRAVPALAALASSTGSATVTVPAATAPGTYYVLACADDLNAVKELSDANNCFSAGPTTVTP